MNEKLVIKGDYLISTDGTKYTVIMDDSEYFLIGEFDYPWIDFTNLKLKDNSGRTSLDKMGLKLIVTGGKYDN